MFDLKLIDGESGVARVGGNLTVYKKLLGKYADGGYLEELDSHIAASSLSDATADAHKIKGVAANLSLMRVNAAAFALEQKLKEGQDYASELDELRRAHNETVAEIRVL